MLRTDNDHCDKGIILMQMGKLQEDINDASRMCSSSLARLLIFFNVQRRENER